MSDLAPQTVRFGADGLAPVVVQDAVSGDVLMLAYMNLDALRLTHETGRAHYWSRGRNAIWRKGETSGHEQVVEEIRVNCEQNSLAPSVTTAIPPASTAGRPQTARSSLSASVRSIRVLSTATRHPRLNGIKHGMLISWRRRPGGSSGLTPTCATTI
jgi:phosphoribosyl-AMP cyclohydrolase